MAQLAVGKVQTVRLTTFNYTNREIFAPLKAKSVEIRGISSEETIKGGNLSFVGRGGCDLTTA